MPPCWFTIFFTERVPSPSPLCLVETRFPSGVCASVPVKVLSTVIQSEPPSVFARTMIFLSGVCSDLQASTAFSNRLPVVQNIQVRHWRQDLRRTVPAYRLVNSFCTVLDTHLEQYSFSYSGIPA